MAPEIHSRDREDPELARSWEHQQTEMRSQLEEQDRLDFVLHENQQQSTVHGALKRIGGVDISYPRNSPSRAVVALTVLAYPSLEILYDECTEVTVTTPYIAGFLAFREMSAYRGAFAQLRLEHPELWPQVVLVDGNGTLHPRRFGSACQLGVELDVPTIGVAKNFLHIDGLSADARSLKLAFQQVPLPTEIELCSADAVYGMAVAPSGGATNPIFVSTGHRVSLRTAVDIVRMCSSHRVPEPIRVADQRSRARAREIEAD
ncbi:hypothetical protein GGF44_005522 [Coemansia sp. RSA 1694]|nr:hypothetical protein GGF38_003256 [Coemansia sp. RSA 25]KAJ2620495.1 hypothetical protein GGF44_005522 [Coemansia sp. RSA 1694]